VSTQHPITPPPELVQQWHLHNRKHTSFEDFWHCFAAQAAQWGADQELEACCGELPYFATELRATRRPKPKPPTLKEQALHELADVYDRDKIDDSTYDTIRRAIEAIDD
jgi:hypothetical protein